MNLFLLCDGESAVMCRQLLRLKAECASLSWSRRISVPEHVADALDTIQQFAEQKLNELCTEDACAAQWGDEQDEALFAAFRESEPLKSILGGGVVLAGEEAETVQRELARFPKLTSIAELFRTGKNLVLR